MWGAQGLRPPPLSGQEDDRVNCLSLLSLLFLLSLYSIYREKEPSRLWESVHSSQICLSVCLCLSLSPSASLPPFSPPSLPLSLRMAQNCLVTLSRLLKNNESRE